MDTKTLKPETLQNELKAWRGKLDELKLKKHLLATEYRHKADEKVRELESAYDDARAKLEKWSQQGRDQAEGVRAGFESAWTAFKSAYEKATA